ncbi:MAG: SLC5 family protein [Phycisphaerales bacterium JB038]
MIRTGLLNSESPHDLLTLAAQPGAAGVSLALADVAVFLVFLAVVIGAALYASRRERTGEDYFLGGRGLLWPMIGLSIVAANISTEQLVSMAGQGAGGVGLAVSNWQLAGSIGIVIIAFTLMPKFLQAGIYTMPEFLEQRFNSAARALMSGYTVVIYVAILLTSVFYSGGLTIHQIFDVPLWLGVILLALAATAYTAWGGLKAVAVADLFFGAALLAGGAYAFLIGLDAVGGWSAFAEANAERLHMIKPADDPNLPWTGVVGGMWIVLLYYCGLNQFIVQRSLAAKSLGHAQGGMVLAAGLWLCVPFFIVMPGIMSAQLYAAELRIGTAAAAADEAFPTLIRNLIPEGVRGFMFAAIAGAVISSLASMLNSASTLFTMDVYKRHLNRGADDRRILWIGRSTVLVCVVIGGVLATVLDQLPGFDGVFNFIQQFQGYIWPGTVAAFLGGMVLKRAPAISGVVALVLGPLAYGLLQLSQDIHGIHYLLQTLIAWAVAFGAVVALTLLRPLDAAWTLPTSTNIDLRTSKKAFLAGMAVIAGVAVFYAVFW